MKIEIETKFDVGDKLFFMRDNKVQNTKIKAIELSYKSKGKIDEHTVEYRMTEGSYVYESEMKEEWFKSREELLKSL